MNSDVAATTQENHHQPICLISIKQILKKLGVGNTQFHTFYKKQPGFPTPIRFSDNKPRWIESEIDNWILSFRTQSNGSYIHKIT